MDVSVNWPLFSLSIESFMPVFIIIIMHSYYVREQLLYKEELSVPSLHYVHIQKTALVLLGGKAANVMKVGL